MGLGQILSPSKEADTFDSTIQRPTPFHFGLQSPASQLSSDFTSTLTIDTPSGKPTQVKNPQQKTLKSAQHFQPANFGLNSILDGSPNPASSGFGLAKKTIKRQSLRSFYGNSVNSPNLTEVPSSAITVRRSPRLNGNYGYYCYSHAVHNMHAKFNNVCLCLL